MSVCDLRNPLTRKRLTLLVTILICLVKDINSAPTCNQSYFSEQLIENTAPIPRDVVDVSKFCNFSAKDDTLDLKGNDKQFTLNNFKIVATNLDADAKLSTNMSEFANPWTMTVKITDPEGNFTILTVFVRITSTNDNNANITNLRIRDILENTPVGTTVGSCTLTDEDYPESGYDIPYVEISVGNGDNKFAVDYKTCKVILIGPLNYASTKSYNLVFRAYNFKNDPASSTTMNVTFNVIPVNVYPPRCSPFNIYTSVQENSPNDTVVANVSCTNFDGTGPVDYYRAASNSVQFFDVNKQSGKVTVINNIPYDTNNPTNNIKQFAVDVTPGGQQSPKTTLTVQISVLDVDNNKPKFTSTVFTKTISSKTTVGSPVLTLNATDADAPNTINSKITFGFDTPCTPNLLEIDSGTGTLYVKGTLNGTSNPQITCKAFAYSSNKSTDRDTADVIITVVEDSNKPPVFSQSVYQGNVTENSASGFSVLSVFATDPDNTIVHYAFPTGGIPSYWPFTIDPVSGSVSVKSLIDYEQKESYFAPVVATDAGVPSLTSSAYVAITVYPQNEFTPVFVNSSLRDAYINKLDTPGTLVTTVTATDGDAGSDGMFEYYLKESNVPFVLEKETGVIRVGIGLDQEKNQFYNLVVFVADQSKTNILSSSATVKIVFNADNKNNNDPVCDPLGPLTVTPKKPNVGDPVGFLTCTDADAKTQLSYDATGGNGNNQFEVVKYNGTIRLATTPVAGTYIIVVTVSDGGTPVRTAVVSVQINIETNLMFTNLPSSLSIFENSNGSNVIYTVSAAGAYDPVKYEIISGNTQGKFNLHQTTGELRLVNTLDRESTDYYDLQIRAAVPNGQSVTQHLTVTVLDKNDNAPMYSSSFDYIKLSESLPAPSPVKRYAATDRDIQENAQLDYIIISGDPNHFFVYDFNGEFRLISKLDYEKQSFYTLVLGVRDRGVPSLNSTMIVNVEVIDDKTDNNVKIVPSGGTVPLTLSEDTTIGAAVIKIEVQNNDTRSDLNFQITSGNNGNNFTIDKTTGVVYLIYALDRESADFMNIGIRVTNSNGKTADTMLFITITDVNDNDPVFNPNNYMFLVPHGTGPGSIIGTLSVTDLDSGVNKDLTLSIISGDTNRFSLNGKSVMAAAVLDANVKPNYELVIQATDHGTSSRNSTAFVIVIIQSEFKKPLFVPKTYSTSVEETRAPGSLLYDADATINGATERSSTNKGDLVYSLSSGDSSKFYVETDIGEVQLVSPLVYSSKASYTLIITASNKMDLSLNDNFTLTITVTQVNRYDPVFFNNIYIWSVNETAALGTVVGRITATDKDLGQFGFVTYAITPNKNFNVSSTTGLVSLTSPLEYSTAKNYNLLVTATDDAGANSKTASAVVTINVIDVNNHAPVFINAPYTITVPENLPLGTVIQMLSAEDLDSGLFGTVFYSIISGNTNGLFALDPSTGSMSVSSNLDYENGRQYILLVLGKDGGTPPLTGTAIVTIDVTDQNDNTPNFGTTRIDLTIKSDTPSLTTVYQVTASDKDSGKNGIVNYIIQSGNGGRLFSIDTVKGVIKTTGSLASADSFQTLLVAGIDQGLPPRTGTVTIVITIQPVQNPGPADYSLNVGENQAVGTLVGTIPNDPSLNNITGYTIRGGNNGVAFEISINANKDGIIRTKIQLDRESYAYYQLLISVTYATGTRDVTVNIKVIDANDNAPVFDKSVLNIQVVENLAAGNTVGAFTVTDADETGVNSQVDLSLSPPTPPASTYFSVDPSGTIKLISPISYEVISSFTFYVVAKDRGTPQQTTTATVNVNVVDVTETKEYNYLKTASFIAYDFPDDAAEGDNVCQLTAADVGANVTSGDTVSYAIVGRDSVFDVHPSSGYLKVSKASFISSDTKYFQWVIVTVISGKNTTSYALMVRLDTFSKEKNLISVKVNVDLGELRSKKQELEVNLGNVFDANQAVQIWSTRSTTSNIRRRKLLASESEALAVVEADRSVNDMSNIGRAKTFLTSEEAMKKMQQSSDGTPVAGLSSSSPTVTSVKPYSENKSDDLDPAYIALIVVGSIVALALIIALIALIIYCTYYRRKNDTDKKKLVEKKKQTKQVFGNFNKSKRSDVRSEPAMNKIDPNDPDSDGMPVRPTTAVFLSTSQTYVSESKPPKNSSTMLESLEEVIEEDGTDGTSHA